MLEAGVFYRESALWLTFCGVLSVLYTCGIALAILILLKLIFLNLFDPRRVAHEEPRATTKDKLESSSARLQTHLASMEDIIQTIRDKHNKAKNGTS